MEDYLKELNKSQKEAVLYTDGPALVIAGAGSGKTRVLTYKIAYLIQQGYRPYTILALTFTNKAAKEMKSRVSEMVGEETASRLWMGTFHSVFSRILRKEAVSLGYTKDFTIYDTADSKSLLRSIIKEFALDEKKYKVGLIFGRISHAKNALISPEEYDRNRSLVEADHNAGIPRTCDIYRAYAARCKMAQAMDFDDLLYNTNILFRDYPDVLKKYRDFFSYVLVDEYQDTNFAQHVIVKKLVANHHHFCVVGDDAQSIYSFRGAEIENILSFEKEYADSRIFKLEQNYRSTKTIVKAANSLIDKNRNQIRKEIYSENITGNKIGLIRAYSDLEEGIQVISKIVELRMRTLSPYSDFAILYRTNAQSRIFEEEARKRGIPYRIYGGLSFYQRKEIKDVISYFRLVVNSMDEEALKRIINYPLRGIGDTTVSKVMSCALTNGVAMWTVLSDPDAYALDVNSGTRRKLIAFAELIQSFISSSSEISAYDLAIKIVSESGIQKELLSEMTIEYQSKRENLQELLNGISLFTTNREEEGEESARLIDFLSEVSLLTDQDSDDEEEASKVTLMTVHSAKGLEFKNVFVVGLEEDLFPSSMCMNSPKAIEEERRLLYVAITRAKENCFLSCSKSRFRNGSMELCRPSRFLYEIDPQFLDIPVSNTVKVQPQPATNSRTPFETAHAMTFPHFKKVSSVTENKKNITSFPQYNLSVGDQIEHERFGKGEVISLEGEGDSCKAKVAFVHVGEKQLLLKFARFKKL
ncbi:MAG: UvrD-helicase domain-containing protein [Bacteroidales bacterium]|nr:UvrD-helicase domain-containing protein [Bacteroidales bacterium]